MTKLEAMLKYVSEHNDFYKKRIKEYGITNPLDITQWPILTRKELQENRYNMFSDGGKSKYLHQQLKRQTSSGSIGIPVSVYWNYSDYYASLLPLWRKRFKYYGISPTDRCIDFTLNTFNTTKKTDKVLYRRYSYNELAINVSLIQKLDCYNFIIDLIKEFSPKWIRIQPFVLQKLLNAYKKLEKYPPNSLVYIESVGELLVYDLKQKAFEFFKVPVANLYGSEEMNGIALECPYNHMHIISGNVYMELSNLDSKEAIITSLTNRIMPLIRYCQGDKLTINTLSQPCLCGSTEPIVSVIKGRVSESIYVTDDIELNSLLLMEMIAEVNNQFADIIVNYSFLYNKSESKLYCYIEMDPSRKEWFSNVKTEIYNIYHKKIIPQIYIDLEIKLNNCSNKDYRKHKIFNITE